MSVWVVFPTCNAERAHAAVGKWRVQGYKVAVLIEDVFDSDFLPDLELLLQVPMYPGYFRACNALAKAVMAIDPKAVAVVCAADDMEPDPDVRADDIGEEYAERFPDGYGVMQPIGDDLDGTDRIAGSPWCGRGWVRDAYEGEGPLCPAFMQFFADELLMHDAVALEKFWSRPDLTQRHLHWTREGSDGKTKYQAENSDKYWAVDQRTFKARIEKGLGA